MVCFKKNMEQTYDDLDEVSDERSFFDFAKALMKDRQFHTNKPIDMSGCQGELGDQRRRWSLAAAIAWAEDSDFGVAQDSKLASSKWKPFATFLHGERTYK